MTSRCPAPAALRSVLPSSPHPRMAPPRVASALLPARENLFRNAVLQSLLLLRLRFLRPGMPATKVLKLDSGVSEKGGGGTLLGDPFNWDSILFGV